MLSNLRGNLTALFCAWFNVPFVVMMAGIGAALGAITGAVSGTFLGEPVLARIDVFVKWVLPLPVRLQDLLPTAGAQIGGILGAIIGGFNGGLHLGWMALVYPWQLLYRGDPMWPVTVAVGQVVVALFVGGLYTVGYGALEPVILRIRGCRRPSRREAAWLLPMVYEVGMRMGLRSVPRVLVDDSREVNAYSNQRHLVICRGLLDEFSYDRYTISGVVAHELAHWSEGHAIQRAFSVGVALPLVILYNVFAWLTGRNKPKDGRIVVRVVRMVASILGWAVLFTAEYIVRPMAAKGYREQEFRADAIAKAAGYGDGLYHFLSRTRRRFDTQRSGWEESIMATHPWRELRLERLERPGRQYVLPDHHALSQLMPGWAPYSSLNQE
jgi:Zn-dependent protease with chaperone function